MSLKRFIKRADVKVKFAPLRPGLPRKIASALMVKPRSERYMVVGTAFDYLLRFELQRRAPHAVTRCWMAEAAADGVWLNPKLANELKESGKEFTDSARKVIEMAKLAHAAYLKNTSPTRFDQTNLAGHAIRLAKLDDIPRAGRFDSTFEEAAAEDVEDLLDLLGVVPFNALLHEKVMFLNPVFGRTSSLVGGADADLIVGDLLVDVKTTKSDKMTADDLDQLLGYYLLARRQRKAAPAFPAVNRLALYFARHGHLWTSDATTWTEHPLFAETEEWFFSHAKEVFKAKAREITWSGVKLDPADMKRTLRDLFNEGRLKLREPPR